MVDLPQDEPWSDFADVLQQRGIFIAVVLLHKAFPTRYGTPDAQILSVSVQRIYADDLQAGAFQSATGLIWDYAATSHQPSDTMTKTFHLTTSCQLFRSLTKGQVFKPTVI